ncbi:MAG: flagellar biosynthesis anti-sigma factor FlgM [Terracidiphilus sp.]
MRIDLFNAAASQVASEPNAKPVPGQNVAPAAIGDGGDRTTLTSGSGPVSSLVSEAMNSPEIRMDKVQNLQQAIGSGQYQLEPDKIAGAMIDEHA